MIEFKDLFSYLRVYLFLKIVHVLSFSYVIFLVSCPKILKKLFIYLEILA